MTAKDKPTVGHLRAAFDRHTVDNRSGRLGRLYALLPDLVACQHCGSPVRPHRRDRRVWEHVTTGLIRCSATCGVTHAEHAA